MSEPGHDTKHDTEHGTERDPALDAAWREASREEPPVALDDAIRAAARRELGAGPRRKLDKHWWYPFAAAAMVGVIAVGLLQLTPPEQVAPVVVAEQDTKPDTAPGAQLGAPGAPDARRDAAAPSAPAPQRDPAPAPSKDAGASSPAPAAPAPKPAPRTKTEPSADQFARTEQGAASGTIAAPPTTTSVPRSEPFPGSPPAAARQESAPSTVQQAPEPSTAPQPPAPSTVAPRAAAPQVAAPPAPRREAPAAEGRLMANRAAPAQDASGEAKPKQARSVEDWIKLIRDLRAEGKLPEATKELSAFREFYGERADSLLPADLRELKTPAAGAK